LYTQCKISLSNIDRSPTYQGSHAGYYIYHPSAYRSSRKLMFERGKVKSGLRGGKPGTKTGTTRSPRPRVVYTITNCDTLCRNESAEQTYNPRLNLSCPASCRPCDDRHKRSRRAWPPVVVVVAERGASDSSKRIACLDCESPSFRVVPVQH